MVGYELDLTSPDFQKLFVTNLDQFVKLSTTNQKAFHHVIIYSTGVFSRILPVAQSSGGTAVSARFFLLKRPQLQPFFILQLNPFVRVPPFQIRFIINLGPFLT